MPTLSADNRLRQKVASIDGTIVLVGAGNVDRVIRFTRLPDCLIPFKTKSGDDRVFPVILNLDRGPDQEAWTNAKREAFLGARRDRPMPEALPVSEDNTKGWSADVDDVPVVEFEAGQATEAPDKFQCENCTVGFNTEHALKIHKGRTKH